MSKNINEFKIAVVGSGTMGLGVATHFAMYGHQVKIFKHNSKPEEMEKVWRQIKENLHTMVEMGVIPADGASSAQENITLSGNLRETVFDADLVIENVLENEGLKKSIFSQLDEYCGKDTILASNTSSLNIFNFLTVSNPERLVITHFFVPAHVMPLVEIVRGPQTSDNTVLTVKELLTHSGKKPAVVNKVIPGFIMNRLTFAIFREAAYMVSQGWCSPEDVDAAIVATHGLRYTFEGPFGLVDFAGADTYERICEYLLPELCDNSEVPGILKELCEKGKLGVKSGEGFYPYHDTVKAQSERVQKIIKMRQAIDGVNATFVEK